MSGIVVIMLAGLQLKHFAADYMLQTRWMIAGKRSLRSPGGYAHAGVHVLGSAPVLMLAGPAWQTLLLLLCGEFLVHYALDYAKVHYSASTSSHDQPGRFWALHGFDQMLHQLTYAAMIYAVLLTGGAGGLD